MRLLVNSLVKFWSTKAGTWPLFLHYTSHYCNAMRSFLTKKTLPNMTKKLALLPREAPLIRPVLR